MVPLSLPGGGKEINQLNQCLLNPPSSISTALYELVVTRGQGQRALTVSVRTHKDVSLQEPATHSDSWLTQTSEGR